jgi:hypothetical protein
MEVKRRTRPHWTGLAVRATVEGALAGLLAAGCEITDGSLADGHFEVKDGDQVVYRGLEKNRRGPWIVMLYNSGRVTWSNEG